jgi:acetolactate synthase-1/2/3 large subunit
MKLAEAYGIRARKISEPKDVKAGLVEMLESKGPFILECLIDKDEDTLK